MECSGGSISLKCQTGCIKKGRGKTVEGFCGLSGGTASGAFEIHHLQKQRPTEGQILHKLSLKPSASEQAQKSVGSTAPSGEPWLNSSAR